MKPFVFPGLVAFLVGCASTPQGRGPASDEIKRLSPEAFGGSKNCADLLVNLRKGIVPAKFTYLGKGAELWKTLMQNSNSVANEPEVKLLKATIPELLKASIFKNGSNIVDIGPGDGNKAIAILKLWKQKRGRYLEIDISPDILALAKDRILQAYPDLTLDKMVVDVEKNNFRESVEILENKSKKPSVFLLLGQTLGNPRDIPAFLSNVRTSMSNDSVLLIGVDLYQPDKIPALLKEYNNPAYLDMDLWVLKEAGLIPDQNGHVKIDFDQEARDIRGVFVLEKDVTIASKGGDVNDTVHLRSGQEILFFRSHRFSEFEIEETLAQVGLQMMHLKIHDQSGYGLVTAKKD